jgi:hypothetical protein
MRSSEERRQKNRATHEIFKKKKKKERERERLDG